MYLMQGDLERTVQSFERAQSLSFYRQDFHLVAILLVSLWSLLPFFKSVLTQPL